MKESPERQHPHSGNGGDSRQFLLSPTSPSTPPQPPSMSLQQHPLQHLPQPLTQQKILSRGDNSPTHTASQSDGRDTTQMLTREQLSHYFDRPIKEASYHLNMSLTQLKKNCRRLGIIRWPFRKVQSVKSRINEKVVQLERATNVMDRGDYQMELQQLQEELNSYYHGSPLSLPSSTARDGEFTFTTPTGSSSNDSSSSSPTISVLSATISHTSEAMGGQIANCPMPSSRSRRAIQRQDRSERCLSMNKESPDMTSTSSFDGRPPYLRLKQDITPTSLSPRHHPYESPSSPQMISRSNSWYIPQLHNIPIASPHNPSSDSSWQTSLQSTHRLSSSLLNVDLLSQPQPIYSTSTRNSKQRIDGAPHSYPPATFLPKRYNNLSPSMSNNNSLLGEMSQFQLDSPPPFSYLPLDAASDSSRPQGQQSQPYRLPHSQIQQPLPQTQSQSPLHLPRPQKRLPSIFELDIEPNQTNEHFRRQQQQRQQQQQHNYHQRQHFASWSLSPLPQKLSPDQNAGPQDAFHFLPNPDHFEFSELNRDQTK